MLRRWSNIGTAEGEGVVELDLVSREAEELKEVAVALVVAREAVANLVAAEEVSMAAALEGDKAHT